MIFLCRFDGISVLTRPIRGLQTGMWCMHHCMSFSASWPGGACELPPQDQTADVCRPNRPSRTLRHLLVLIVHVLLLVIPNMSLA